MDTATNKKCFMGCGHTGMDTLKMHLVAWMRGIMSTMGFTVDREKTLVPTNFSMLAEKLLYPHGAPTGMLDLIDHIVAEDCTCACEIVPVTIPEAEGVAAGSNANKEAEVEDMETAEKELPELGREAILKKFGNSRNLANLVAMVS